jgi:hypothetical protein
MLVKEEEDQTILMIIMYNKIIIYNSKIMMYNKVIYNLMKWLIE